MCYGPSAKISANCHGWENNEAFGPAPWYGKAQRQHSNRLYRIIFGDAGKIKARRRVDENFTVADAGLHMSYRCRRRLSGPNPVATTHGNFPNWPRRDRKKQHFNWRIFMPVSALSAHPALLAPLRSVLVSTIDATCLYCVLPISSFWGGTTKVPDPCRHLDLRCVWL